jgi:hypothetical protein
MAVAEVKAILGNPDLTRPLYEPKIKKPRRIGTTYWYLIEKNGPDSEAGDRLVRVSLDLHQRVMKVDHWGFADERDRKR